jgi:pimeloyl-ACP methyl ester carboxylesterase
MTEIDGLDIHFIHVRSKHEDALPLIVTHGWPGSIIEQLSIIGPLTDPTAHGASASDAFHLVIPSMPGYGFSGKPTKTGWDPVHIGPAWVELMKRLGYTQFVAQGGDWGAIISHMMAEQAPPELLGTHSNLPATVPPEIIAAIQRREPPPADLSADEKRAYQQVSLFLTKDVGYAIEMGNRPQTLYGLADSPIGLAAWILDGHPPNEINFLKSDKTRDEMLDNITLYYWPPRGCGGRTDRTSGGTRRVRASRWCGVRPPRRTRRLVSSRRGGIRVSGTAHGPCRCARFAHRRRFRRRRRRSTAARADEQERCHPDHQPGQRQPTL